MPAAIQRPVPLGDSAIGRALIGLLRCVGRGADGAPPPGTSADLLAWLRAPGLLRVPALADDLERELRRQGTTAVPRARALWEQRNWPLEALDELQAAQARSPAALIDRCGRELARLLSAPLQGTATVLAGDQADEALAHAAAARALGELRELAVRAPELAPSDAPALAGELAAVEFLGGRPPGGDAVAVLDPLALRARRVRALFLCGLQEGAFPSQRRRRGLLSEEDRFELERLSGIRLGRPEDPLAAERYLLYAAVSRPEELLVLSWHLADDEGLSTSRSLFVEDVCDLFEEQLLEQPLRGGARATSPAGSGAREGTGDGGSDRSLHDERVLGELAGRPWSASQLEKYIGCPMRWYIERILRPASWDPDAEPLRRGGLAHAVLKDTLEGLRERTGSAAVTPSNLETARELLAEALARREPEHPLSVSAERLPGARLKLHTDLERYLEHAARAEWPLEPGPLELSFGLPAEEEGDLELPAFELGDGVVLRGRIDRVDYSPAGDAVVVDYKSGAGHAALTLDQGGQGPGPALHARRRASAGAHRGGRLLPAPVGRGPARPRDPRRVHTARARLRRQRRAARGAGARAAGRGARDGPLGGREGPKRGARAQARDVYSGGWLQLPVDLPVSLTDEQLAAVQRRSGPLSLSAAAGSGKTAVLVERFVAAVLQDGLESLADPRDHVHRPRPPASCASVSARASSSRASARPRATPRPPTSPPSTASARDCSPPTRWEQAWTPASGCSTRGSPGACAATPSRRPWGTSCARKSPRRSRWWPPTDPIGCGR